MSKLGVISSVKCVVWWCCVQLVPDKWVCALGGPRDAPLLSERRVCAGSLPLNSAFNRDRFYRGFLPPLPKAGKCLTYGYKGSASFNPGVKGVVFFGTVDDQMAGCGLI